MEKYRLLLVAVALLIAVSITACSGKPFIQNTQTGGTTDRTDHTAPKEIKSRDITRFNVTFYFRDPYYYDREGFCSFCIKKNDAGEYILQAQGVGYKIEEPVDTAAVLPGVQEIIERYDLVRSNGVYKVTAGLPPEYQPWALDVEYASGEELHIYENGAPYAAWTEAFKEYFEGILVDMDHEEILPPKEEMILEKASLCFDDGEYVQEYREITKGDGSAKFISHFVSHMTDEEDQKKEYAEITDDYYEGLQQVFEEYAFTRLHHPETVTFSLDPEGESFLEIYVDYENDYQIYAELKGEELPDNWPVMRAAFREYVDAYIAEHRVDRDAVFGN